MEAIADVLDRLERSDIGRADPALCSQLLTDAKRVRGWLDAQEARISARARELHDTAGGAPAADLHTRCGGVSAAEGRRKARRSEAIDDAPSFGEALATGLIGAEHVDALANVTAHLDDGAKSALLDLEADLLDDARSMSPERFGRSCRDLARRLERDRGIERNRRQRDETFLSRRLNAATGMVEGRFALHPELANQVFGAVDREVAAMAKEGADAGEREFVERSFDRNRLAAEALGRLVAGGKGQVRPLEADITLLVDIETGTTGELHDHSICETAEGLALPPESVRRLMCQGRVTPIILGGDAVPLAAGRTIRAATRAQRRALRAMYSCCGFDGCDVAFDRCEMHHILPWELGGPTDLQNLIPLCSRHHHVVHEGGWRLDLDADRTLTISTPDGGELARCRPDLIDRRRRRRTAA